MAQVRARPSEGPPDVAALLSVLSATEFGRMLAAVGASSHDAVSPTSGTYWASDVLLCGIQAVVKSAFEVASEKDIRRYEVNILSAIGDLVGTELRRLVLRGALEKCDWNLSRCAVLLGMGRNAAIVIREIKRTGLTAEYEAARAAGRVRRHWREAATSPPKRLEARVR